MDVAVPPATEDSRRPQVSESFEIELYDVNFDPRCDHPLERVRVSFVPRIHDLLVQIGVWYRVVEIFQTTWVEGTFPRICVGVEIQQRGPIPGDSIPEGPIPGGS